VPLAPGPQVGQGLQVGVDLLRRVRGAGGLLVDQPAVVGHGVDPAVQRPPRGARDGHAAWFFHRHRRHQWGQVAQPGGEEALGEAAGARGSALGEAAAFHRAQLDALDAADAQEARGALDAAAVPALDRLGADGTAGADGSAERAGATERPAPQGP
jgi:hypothetical protein